MWKSLIAIFVGLIAVLWPTRAGGAVVPTAPTSIPLISLLGGTSVIVTGPFTFSQFSLAVENGNTWQAGPGSLAAELSVRGIRGNDLGLELAGTPAAAALMSAYSAVAIDYQLNSTVSVGGADVTLYATASNAAAALANRAIITPLASSNSPPEADTNWSSANSEGAPALPILIEFLPSTTLLVSDVSSVSPVGAYTLSFAIDTIYVPEPAGFTLAAAGCLLPRRRRVAL